MEDQAKFWRQLKSGHFVPMVKEAVRGQEISSAQEVYNIMKPVFAETDDVETLYCLYLDTKNRILAMEKMFTGSLSSTAVYPREIIKRVIALKSSAVVITHNHPTGDPGPSVEDTRITIRLLVALKSMNVDLHDHIIVGEGYYSFADAGVIGSADVRFCDFLCRLSRE
ncbi:JAB domain-containing protein [Desulfosudis oleivorans]|uniref:DNA repair protein RadC n=1 Tax=Desulfosudis oleivorans (strain DSM 6200 / JCM 39069 / Hxd3) TaxID=96561 RepID=A8ZYJ4_DESOH|nr:JAB domain-containing protein [Desulfosudis oleivorans]ABW68719.1 DNA repair protein RadC [Desulfosudis oleivorans Hxd3]